MTLRSLLAVLLLAVAASPVAAQEVASPSSEAIIGPAEVPATDAWSFELCKAAGSTVLDLGTAYSGFVQAVASGSVTGMVGSARRLDRMAYWAGGDLDEVPSDVPEQVAAFVASGKSLVSSARRVASAALTVANRPKQRKANTRLFKRAVKNLSSDLTVVDAAQNALFDTYPGVCDKPPGTITRFAPFDDRVHATLDDIGGIMDDILWNTKHSSWTDMGKDLARLEARVDEEFRYLDQLAPTDCWADSVDPWRSAIRALEIAEREGTRWVTNRTNSRWDAWIAAVGRFDRANSDANGALNEVRIQVTFGRCE